MIYKWNVRIRYSETDPDKKLGMRGMINYFQDCSTFHSEEIGLGINSLEESKHVWMLSSWQIVIKKRPELGERVWVSTWPHGFQGFYGDRNFTLTDEKGEMLAYANSIWVFVDTKSGRPCRVTEEELAGYELEEKLDMEYAPRKIRVPKEMEELDAFPVRKYHIDTNKHVNNSCYIEMAQEFLPEGFEIRQIRTEYKKAAVYGNTMYPMRKQEEGLVTIALCDENGRPYAVVEFEGSSKV